MMSLALLQILGGELLGANVKRIAQAASSKACSGQDLKVRPTRHCTLCDCALYIVHCTAECCALYTVQRVFIHEMPTPSLAAIPE